jgi:hypothetical protein
MPTKEKVALVGNAKKKFGNQVSAIGKECSIAGFPFIRVLFVVFEESAARNGKKLRRRGRLTF